METQIQATDLVKFVLEMNKIKAGSAAGTSLSMGLPVVLQALDDTGIVANDSVHGVPLKAADMLQETTQETHQISAAPPQLHLLLVVGCPAT